MGYRILDHTADVGLEVQAPTLEELFESAALGMTAIFVSGEIHANEKMDLALKADNLENLLHDWLSEINYLFLVRQKVFCKFVVHEVQECALKATCYGEAYEPERHFYNTEIKAVTYHQMAIAEKTPHVWHARVFFDL